MAEQIQIRVDDAAGLTNLVYLPGLHGDWTLIGGFRKHVEGHAQFAQITYPRTLDWSLDEYAAGVEAALKSRRIEHGWLLAESFGSQVAWAMLGRGQFRAEGVVLAGGFVRHPARWAARLAERVTGRIPLSLMVRIMFGYARIARFRYRRSPATLAGIQEFIARRTELDRQAAVHRLHLVAHNDPGPIARLTRVPVYGLAGFIDPIVPWFRVRRWLRQNCPAFKEFRIIRGADHNVLSTAPQKSAAQVLVWMAQIQPRPKQ